MNNDTLGYISVAPHLDSFKKYIDDNERSVLSARFGDGKSYFLDQFKKEYKDDCEFITLYPVNYQVADNKDIFEYIKRDILMQLLSVIELDEADYENSMYLYFYIQNNALDLIGDMSKLGRIIGGDGISILFENFKRYNAYKNKIQNTPSALESFLNSFDFKAGSIYEFDFISELIRCSLEKLRKKDGNNKDVVLIIEDLDRIDPAHIFRILNIISAHTDRSYVGYNELNTNNHSENKFGFDKIVLVCDYDNIEKIFHHFYGTETDFYGYIGKFSTSAPYIYSLKEHIKTHIINKLDPEIAQFKKISYALASLVYDRHISDRKIDKHKERLRKINDDLNKSFAAIGGGTIKIESVGCELPRLNKLSKLVLLLKRFDILDKFTETYLQYGSGDQNIGLVKDELHGFVGKQWMLLSNFETQFEFEYKVNRLTFGKKNYSTKRYHETTNITDEDIWDAVRYAHVNEHGIYIDDLLRQIVKNILPKNCY